MMNTKLKNTTFKDEQDKYWIDASYISFAYTIDVTFSTFNVELIEDSPYYLSKEYYRLKESLNFNELEFDSSFKILIGQNKISYNNPINRFYIFADEVILFKLSDGYSNLENDQINFILFKSFILIKPTKNYQSEIITSMLIIDKNDIFK